MNTAPPLTITPKTTIHTLLKEYPFLLDFLAEYHPEFKKLTNPVLRRTVGRMATLDAVAEQGNVPLNRLTDDIATEVEKRTGTRPPVADVANAETIDPARLAELHAIVKDLHAGKSVEEVKPRFEELIQDVEATEIAAMEQKLIEGGVPDTEVKRLCDVHVQVFADALEGHAAVTAPPGHPLDTFQRENQALLQVTASLRKVAEAIGEPPDGAAWARLKGALSDTVERLAEVDKHYLRKENQLFPFLEDHGVEGPSKVMWAIHDDIRALVKQARATITEDDAAMAVSTCLALAKMVDDMVTKEEKVLHPMAIDTLSEAEWAKIRAGEDDIGYAFIEDVPAWPAAGTAAEAGAAGAPAGAAEAGALAAAGLLALDTGELNLEELNLVLGVLPIDFQYVDEHDRVRFYSEGHRIFPRSPGVIGRKVQNCHPPASVHKVQQIIDAFRAGEKDTADFWIEMQGKFLHIRYFAVRDGGGAYRGVVETVQDVTAIRALEGQRRLLDW
ncbi:MAG TPA: DUF438 domain-containing protein [Thermoleophilia bacterium]|nr:DUF438 domain-containing protein [Thermoleophilia bacterium]